MTQRNIASCLLGLDINEHERNTGYYPSCESLHVILCSMPRDIFIITVLQLSFLGWFYKNSNIGVEIEICTDEMYKYSIGMIIGNIDLSHYDQLTLLKI